MCGRIVQVLRPDEVAVAMDAVLDVGLGSGSDWRPRWNMPPSQLALVVAPADGGRRLERAIWGLPGAGKDGATRSLFNARAETVDRLPSFREPFRHGRVLVPVDAFYEWENPEHLAAAGKGTSPRGRRQPWAFLPTDGPLLALAGISVRTATADGEPIRAFSLVTTEANAVVGAIHDRMPVLLAREDRARWLDPETPREDLFPLLGSAPDAALVARRVSTEVSSVRNDGPHLLEEVSAEPRLF
ncbi:MAG: SOS response-associated peptidase [Actinomycetota bacterium]